LCEMGNNSQTGKSPQPTLLFKAGTE